MLAVLDRVRWEHRLCQIILDACHTRISSRCITELLLVLDVTFVTDNTDLLQIVLFWSWFAFLGLTNQSKIFHVLTKRIDFLTFEDTEFCSYLCSLLFFSFFINHRVDTNELVYVFLLDELDTPLCHPEWSSIVMVSIGEEKLLVDILYWILEP